MQHPIQMRAAVSKSLFNSLLDEVSRIVLMQTQHTYKLLHPTSPLRPFLAADGQHLVITLRPVLAPLSHRSGVVEGTRSLFQQGEVMQRFEHILLTCVTAAMASQERGSIQDLDMEGIGFHND